MKLLSTLVAVIAFVSSAAAAPAAAEPEAAIVARDNHHGNEHHHNRLKPHWVVQVHEANPDHPYGDGQQGKVARHNGAHNVHTLMQFHFDSSLEDYTCTLYFNKPSHVSGSRSIQVFTLGEDITLKDTWNDRPYRDQHIATINNIWEHSHAEIDIFGYPGESFDCPVDEIWNFELVPVGDNDSVTWERNEGFVILYAPNW